MIEWRALAPVLLVLFARHSGILAEAVVPTAHRFFAQVFLTVADRGGAVLRGHLLAPRAGGRRRRRLDALDGPTYFIWGACWSSAPMSILIFAER